MSANGNLQYKEVPTRENGESKPLEPPESYGYGIRHVQVLLATVSLTIAFVSRSHMGVTIVAMTNKPLSQSSHIDNASIALNIIAKNNHTTVWEDVDYDNDTAFDEDFALDNITAKKNDSINPVSLGESGVMTYDWPKSTQEMILGSFFLGYSIMMFPMGMVGQKWGGKLPIQIALLISGLSSILTPWLMKYGSWRTVCACRILIGFSQAGLIPGIQITVSRWSSPKELGRFITYVYTGTTLGTIIAFQLAGFLAASSWGWPATFWVTGGLCLFMFAVLSVFGSASPAVHKSISIEEKNYIMGAADVVVRKSLKIPWKALVSSKHVWATIATHVGSGLSFIFFFNQAPSYIHYILGMNVKKSGLLSSLPYASNVVMNIVYGLGSDVLTNRKILSVANSRRFFNSFSQIGLTLSYVAVSFTTNIELAVVSMVLAMSFHAAIHCGWMVNHIDLAPNYAGTLMAIGNTIMCSMSVLMPVLISLIVTDVTNQFQWRTMFLLMASLSFITNAIFVFFMSADTQPWNELGYTKTGTSDDDKEEDQSETK